MTRPGHHLKMSERTRRIARNVKQGLIALISILILLMLGVLAGMGPYWVSEHRKQLAGVIGLVVVILIILSPLIIEVVSSPRTLKGPGKNPEGPNLP